MTGHRDLAGAVWRDIDLGECTNDPAIWVHVHREDMKSLQAEVERLRAALTWALENGHYRDDPATHAEWDAAATALSPEPER